MKCFHCDREILDTNDITIDINGDVYCADCYGNLFRCEKCDRWCRTYDLTAVINGNSLFSIPKFYCDDCLKEEQT